MNQTASAPAPMSFATPFEAIGGEAGIRRLVNAFYDGMDADPAFGPLRAMHQPDLGPMRARLADWLSGWLGGPSIYAGRHPGRPCIASAHAPFRIDAGHADQWLACMRAALDESDMPEDWRAQVDAAFARMCQAFVNA